MKKGLIGSSVKWSLFRVGKTETFEIELETPSEQRPARHRRRVAVLRHSQRDWTPEGRLAILVDAIDDAVCKPVIMGSDLVALCPSWKAGRLCSRPDDLLRTYPRISFARGCFDSQERKPEIRFSEPTSHTLFALIQSVASGKQAPIGLSCYCRASGGSWMPISTNTFLQEIRAALGPLARDAKQSTRAWDLYEVLVFGAVVESARSLNAQVDLLDSTGNPATRYLFRSRPGPLAQPSQRFTHADIRFPGHPDLEAHTGIFVLGKSQLAHECDCVVLPKGGSRRSKNGRGTDAALGTRSAPRVKQVLQKADSVRAWSWVSRSRIGSWVEGQHFGDQPRIGKRDAACSIASEGCCS